MNMMNQSRKDYVLKILTYGTLFSQLNITGKCIALLRRFSVIFDIIIKFPYIELLAISVIDSYRGYHICLRMFFFGDAVALLRESYVCLEILLCFLHLCDRAYVLRAQCIGLFLFLVALAPHDLNVDCFATCIYPHAIGSVWFRQKTKLFSMPFTRFVDSDLYTSLISSSYHIYSLNDEACV